MSKMQTHALHLPSDLAITIAMYYVYAYPLTKTENMLAHHSLGILMNCTCFDATLLRNFVKLTENLHSSNL